MPICITKQTIENKLLLKLRTFLIYTLTPIVTATVLFALYPGTAYAVCPVCTVAVGAGLGISRWLGIDDSVVGVWVGGLIVSGSLWFSSTLLSKLKINQTLKQAIAIGLFGAVIYSVLVLAGYLGLPFNTILGIDKIIFGAGIGIITFLFSTYVDKQLRASNEGKVYIYYQKVLLPMAFLSLSSYVMYLVTK